MLVLSNVCVCYDVVKFRHISYFCSLCISMTNMLVLISYSVDFNECVNDSTNNCHINATCLNTEGSFQCQCLEGFSGNGVNCTGKTEIRK